MTLNDVSQSARTGGRYVAISGLDFAEGSGSCTGATEAGGTSWETEPLIRDGAGWLFGVTGSELGFLGSIGSVTSGFLLQFVTKKVNDSVKQNNPLIWMSDVISLLSPMFKVILDSGP